MPLERDSPYLTRTPLHRNPTLAWPAALMASCTFFSLEKCMGSLLEYVGYVHIYLGPYRGNPIALYMKRSDGQCRIGPKAYPWNDVIGVGETPNKAAADFEEKWKGKGLSADMYSGPSWEGGIKPEKPAPPKPAAAPKPAAPAPAAQSPSAGAAPASSESPLSSAADSSKGAVPPKPAGPTAAGQSPSTGAAPASSESPPSSAAAPAKTAGPAKGEPAAATPSKTTTPPGDSKS